MLVDIFVGFVCEIGGEADKDKNSLRENLFFTLSPYKKAFAMHIFKDLTMCKRMLIFAFPTRWQDFIYLMIFTLIMPSIAEIFAAISSIVASERLPRTSSIE